MDRIGSSPIENPQIISTNSKPPVLIEDEFRDNNSMISRDEQYRKDLAFATAMSFDDTVSVCSDTASTISKNDIETIIQQRMEAEMERRIQQRVDEEVRRRVEENMRKEELRRAEEEKRVAEQKEAAELEELYKKRDEENSRSYTNYSKFTPLNKLFIKKLQTNGEKILYLECDQLQGRREKDDYSDGANTQYIHYMITNRNVYSMKYILQKPPSEPNRVELQVMSLYVFDKPLSSSHVKMLSILSKNPDTLGIFNGTTGQYHTLQPLLGRIKYHGSCNNNQGTTNYDESALRMFESIIRIIPGSYQNGDWQQLDGFFGMYYNNKTMECSYFPGKTLTE
jgi:hypothetical protein